jgi:tetratricopeptide (TPR) repeat protein
MIITVPHTHGTRALSRIVRAFILLCVCAAFSLAQDPTVSADAQPRQVASGEQFEFIITVSASSVNGIKPPAAPNFGSFVLLSGPNQSTNMQWINGRTSASVSYSYALYARQAGKQTIPAMTVDCNGKLLSTQPIQIDVVKGNPANKPAQQQAQDPAVAASVADNLLLRAVADRQRVRRGEQVTITYKLYNNIEISQVRQKKDPAVEGFWSEDIATAKQLQYTNETLNGKRYRVAIIRTIALFPTQSGTLTVGPLELTCGVLVRRPRRSNDVFDSFFNDPFFQQLQSVEHDVKSNALSITVDPLPPGAPDGFSGAVGAFTFSATMDRSKMKSGDPATLRLTVIGAGNIRLVTMPKPALPGDIEAYEPKLSEDISREGGVVRGKKVAEYLLVPRNPGERVIEPIAFSYFDLPKNSYQTIRSPRFVLNIEQGKTFAGNGTPLASKEDVRLLGEDIRFVKMEAGRLEHADTAGTSSTISWLALFFPPLAFVGAFIYRKRVERLRGDMPRLLFERAGREASRRLKQARVLLEKGNAAAFYAELLRAMSQYLENKLSLPPSEFTFDAASERLRTGNVPDDIRMQLKNCVEGMEYARYAPGSDSAQARKDLLDRSGEVINGIERTFRGTKNANGRQTMAVIAMILLTSSGLVAQNADELFNRGNDLYRAGKYEEAAASFEQIRSAGMISVAIYHNLGNCYYRLGRIAPAMLAYERAAKLDPTDADVRHNLRLLSMKTIDRIEPVPQLFIIEWIRSAGTIVSSTQAWDAFLIAWAALFISLALLFISSSSSIIRLVRITSLTAVMFVIATGAFSLMLRWADQSEHTAIVTTFAVTAKSSPDAQSVDAFVVHEGLKVHISDSVGSWVKITLPDGMVGWIQASHCEQI